ncbi:tryptophan synthase subunit alpha [Pacificibacter marinus]|uniref:tryptophan synthase n=2 Tax=Pacificibacter marinus TaxID=658057 RepID=A0A1Y5RDD7_9RHOB|nr:tryptophan synthase, alpha chain [Pacificibacter marinus]SLN14808.1 Tryptophan synthase alpha chain [Pacificibacter marinus]
MQMPRRSLRKASPHFESDKPLLSCYFPLGDPKIPLDMIDVYADQGVDVLEIGLSAVDPFMDGPDVRASMKRANSDRARANLDAIMERLAKRTIAPKALLMGYGEAEHAGYADAEFWAGLDSCLIVSRNNDAITQQIQNTAIGAGVAPSAFIEVPLTEQGVTAAQKAAFYVMLQASAGQTGPRKVLDPESRNRITHLRAAGVSVPILLGFGISNGMQAREALAFGADGVIVGSQVLRAALEGPQALASLLIDLRSGLDA